MNNDENLRKRERKSLQDGIEGNEQNENRKLNKQSSSKLAKSPFFSLKLCFFTLFLSIILLVIPIVPFLKFDPTITIDQGTLIKIYVNKDYKFPKAAIKNVMK